MSKERRFARAPNGEERPITTIAGVDYVRGDDKNLISANRFSEDGARSAESPRGVEKAVYGAHITVDRLRELEVQGNQKVAKALMEIANRSKEERGTGR